MMPARFCRDAFPRAADDAMLECHAAFAADEPIRAVDGGAR